MKNLQRKCWLIGLTFCVMLGITLCFLIADKPVNANANTTSADLNYALNFEMQINELTIQFIPGNGDPPFTVICSYVMSEGLTFDQVLTKPINYGYEFIGYFSGTTQYFNADMVCDEDKILGYEGTTLILTASWIPVTSSIVFITDNFDNGPIQETATYGLIPPDITPPSAPGKRFLGYYTQPDGKGKQYYDENGNGIQEWYYVKTTPLFDHFEYIVYGISYFLESGEQMLFPAEVTPTSYIISQEDILINSFDYNGYHYTWNIDKIENGTYGDINIIGTRTIITYNITYVMNGGTNDATNPSSYTVENAVALKNPKHKERGFIGWTINGSYSNTLVGKTGDLTIIANWTSLDIVTCDSSYKYTVTEEYSKIDMTNENANILHTIEIKSNVKQLYITASPYFASTHVYKLHITGGFNNEINLCFDNISIVGPNCLGAIMVTCDVNLYTYGEVNIYGGSGYENVSGYFSDYRKNGGFAIYCYNLIIRYADDLAIIGGNGGSSTTDAGDAGSGVLIDGSYVIIDCDNVTIAAGVPKIANIGGVYSIGLSSEAILSFKTNSTLYIKNGVSHVYIYSSDQRPSNLPGPGSSTSPFFPDDTYLPQPNPDVEMPPIPVRPVDPLPFG